MLSPYDYDSNVHVDVHTLLLTLAFGSWSLDHSGAPRSLRRLLVVERVEGCARLAEERAAAVRAHRRRARAARVEQEDDRGGVPPRRVGARAERVREPRQRLRPREPRLRAGLVGGEREEEEPRGAFARTRRGGERWRWGGR